MNNKVSPVNITQRKGREVERSSQLRDPIWTRLELWHWDVPRQDVLPAGEALCKCRQVREQMLDGKSV